MLEGGGIHVPWVLRRMPGSGEDLLHGMRLLHPGETGVETLEFKAEAFVIDPHAVQDGRVHVVDVHRISDDVVTVIIGGTVNVSAFHSAAGHPN